MKVTDLRNLEHLTLEQQQQVQEKQQQQAEAHQQLARQKAAAKYRHMDVPTATLNTGAKIPLVGLGTWKSSPGVVKEAAVTAIKAGYRHIDCAAIYGNEAEVGQALAQVLGEGVVARDQLFITSKLWNSEHGAGKVEAACRRSLKDLQLDYLDLYLVHWPVTGVPGPSVQPPLAETWGAMEGLVDAGLVRAVGVSNFSSVKLVALLEGARVTPAVLQVEAHPYWRNTPLLDWAASKGIHVTAYSPLGSPDSADALRRELDISPLKDPVVLQVAQRVGKDAGQVLLRWGLQRGTSVLPKSTNPGRIQSNLEIVDWQLSAADMEALSGLEVQTRSVVGSYWLNKEGPYTTLAQLWDDPEEDSRRAALVRRLYRHLDTPQPTATLNTGAKIPLVGLGTWKSEPGVVKDAVKAAIRAGYRHIDCAAIYGNEAEVGAALQEVFAEGVVGRGDLWVTSKLWNSAHGKDQVLPALQKTLQDLQLEYLDLYLVHWPSSLKPGPSVQPPLSETWGAMEEAVGKGLVRAVGVSNFSSVKLGALLEGARVTPAVLQVEAHPYWRNTPLLDWAASKGIHVTAYSPLGSPDSATMMQRGADTPSLLQDTTVGAIAARCGKSPAQVLLRWGLQRGTSVLPKSTNPGRIQSNLEIVDWELSAADMEALNGLEFQQRMVAGAFLVNPAGPYTTLEQLWDGP